MLSKITTNLVVPSVNDTLDFYERILGFGLVMGVPAGSQEIVTSHSADACLWLSPSSNATTWSSCSSPGEPVAGVARVETAARRRVHHPLFPGRAMSAELYESIRRKVTILKDLHTTFYGTEEFYIRDCNGYVLTFAGSPKEPTA